MLERGSEQQVGKESKIAEKQKEGGSERGKKKKKLTKVFVCEGTHVYTHRRSQSDALGYYKGAPALPEDENKTQKIHNKGKNFLPYAL